MARGGQILTEPLREKVHTQNKNLQALLLVPRVFVPCKVCESCKEDRSRFCLNSHGGNEQFCLSVLRNFPGCGWGQDCMSPAALQWCKWSLCRFQWSFSPGKASFLLELFLFHSSSSCLGTDSGAHMFAWGREVAQVVSCGLPALSTSCQVRGLCTSQGLPPPAGTVI